MKPILNSSPDKKMFVKQLTENFFQLFAADFSSYAKENRYPSDEYLRVVKAIAVTKFQQQEDDGEISEAEYIDAAFEAYSKFVLEYQ